LLLEVSFIVFEYYCDAGAMPAPRLPPPIPRPIPLFIFECCAIPVPVGWALLPLFIADELTTL
jgi:hypothetical protein